MGNADRAFYSGRTLVLAMILVVASFLASTVYSQVRLLQVDRHASAIADNGAPSIEHLSAARTALRHLELGVDEYVRARPEMRGRRMQEADAGRADLQRELDAYAALSRFEGETRLYVPVPGDLQRVLEVEHAARTLVEEDRIDEARTLTDRQLDANADRLDAVLLELMRFNAERSHEHALAISRVRYRESLVAYALDAISLLFAVVATVLVARNTRRHTDFLQARSAELEQFAGRVGHDILSPLGAVGLALDTTARDPSLDPRLKTRLERGRGSLERTRRIVDGLLDFARSGARPDPGERSDVTAVAGEVIDELRAEAERADVTLSFEPPAPRLTVATSNGVLISLLENILRNAIKYIGEGADRRVSLRIGVRQGVVRFEVEDNGLGVPPHLASTIFEPYVRAPGLQQPGIGLGLATVKRIAEAHGGRVGMRSRTGGGSLFWFELPSVK